MFQATVKVGSFHVELPEPPAHYCSYNDDQSQTVILYNGAIGIIVVHAVDLSISLGDEPGFISDKDAEGIILSCKDLLGVNNVLAFFSKHLYLRLYVA